MNQRMTSKHFQVDSSLAYVCDFGPQESLPDPVPIKNNNNISNENVTILNNVKHKALLDYCTSLV
uniref:Uncharacterized protein n=1 Tax=Arundo donax TaxID=35708 RepID=A0A0A9H868_ARUDO